MTSPDLFDVLKTSEDLMAIGRAASLQEGLAIHERMLQRQRERENRDALQKANEIAERQSHSLRSQNRLLRKHQEAQDAERMRIAGLPKCPECQSPIIGDMPRRCASCGATVLWVLGAPYGEQGFTQALSQRMQPALERLLVSLRSAAFSLERAAARTGSAVSLKSCADYEGRFNEWVVRASLEQAAVRGRVNEVCAQQSSLKKVSRDTERAMQGADKAVQNVGFRQTLGVVLASGFAVFAGFALFLFDIPQVDAEAAAAFLYPLAACSAVFSLWLGFFTARLPSTVRQAKELIAREQERLSREQKELSHLENSPRNALHLFFVTCGGIEYSPRELASSKACIQSLVASHGPAKVGQALSELFLKLSDFCPFAATDVESEMFIDESIAAAAIANARSFVEEIEGDLSRIPGGGNLIPKDVGERLTLIKKAVAPSKPDSTQLACATEIIPLAEGQVRPLVPPPSTSAVSHAPRGETPNAHETEATGALLLESLCCIAVADGKVSQPEITRIVEALEKLGVCLPNARLQAVAVEACKKIHGAGVRNYSVALCSRLVAMGNAGLCTLILEWQKKVLVVDGATVESEMEIVRIFEEQLAVIAQRAGKPDYLDLSEAGICGAKATSSDLVSDSVASEGNDLVSGFLADMARKMVASRLAAEQLPSVDEESERQREPMGRPSGEGSGMDDFVVECCMKAMCLVAAVDNTLKDAEINRIVEAVVKRQKNVIPEELRSRVIATCKELSAAGHADVAKALVAELKPHKGRPLGQLVLDLMKEVASADGTKGNRERQIIDYFSKHLDIGT